MASGNQFSAELVQALHELYAIQQRICDIQSNWKISNTTVTAVALEVKNLRGNRVNSTHTGVMTLIAGT